MAMNDANEGSAFEETAMAGCRSGNSGATAAFAAAGRAGEGHGNSEEAGRRRGPWFVAAARRL